MANSLPLLHRPPLTGAIATPDGEGFEAGSVLVYLGRGCLCALGMGKGMKQEGGP